MLPAIRLHVLPVPMPREYEIDWPAEREAEYAAAMRMLMAGLCIGNPLWRSAARFYEDLQARDPESFTQISQDVAWLLKQRLNRRSIEEPRLYDRRILAANTLIAIRAALRERFPESLESYDDREQRLGSAHSPYVRHYIRTMLDAFERPPREEW